MSTHGSSPTWLVHLLLLRLHQSQGKPPLIRALALNSILTLYGPKSHQLNYIETSSIHSESQALKEISSSKSFLSLSPELPTA
ncbi:hypothetical protein P152DRAFT_453736 [Eremomyces bilateralis CBS 781.70]|uniref:Uncharacterized protein n=1 Tax=Eremomyces bilateralis CBS 781.70 TaxID=1392243 RepID=A0A6G1GGW1_9PEZI|nr:uncharacterized protein P152DRAFT_453736 [Eremomyces bilateralis CBS 781.70]KAF1817141.1 hypothetical protein P152DRAFT_453736 [Eremomyces bilateralis CBS 781.70]